MASTPSASTLPAWLDAQVTALRAAHALRGITVAFSGGLDSSVLLHALAHAPMARSLGLGALHIHHGLHAEADAWLEHCARTCHALGVPFTSTRVTVRHDAGDGPEGAARHARMRAFAGALSAGQVIALAHHQDDQAETFLLRALRGAGPGGLGAMPAWRSHGAGALWRPLLELPRARLLDYARLHELAWIEDPANGDRRLARSALRLDVMPRLREHWPEAEANLARCARLAAEADALLRADDLALLATLRSQDPTRLDLAGLGALPRARRSRVIRTWIDSLGLPPIPHAQLQRIERELLPAAPDACARVQWQDVVVARWRDGLHALLDAPPWPTGWECGWDGQGPLALPDGGALRLHSIHVRAEAIDPLPLACHVRARRGGERLRLPGRNHHHALKSLLQASDLPPWHRERLPLLCANVDGRVLAAGDRWLSAEFTAWLEQQGLRLDWCDGGATCPHLIV
jgi:tRNA(Ile)-lysidine synthase